MEKDYDEEVEKIDDDYSYEEATEEEKEQREIEKEQSTQVRKGQVEFEYVNHSERAVKKFKRVSDGDTTKYVNIALEYFGHRCVLSGERFVLFEEKIQGKKSNLSAEHVVALCLGGDDIVPNIVPTVLQYNLRKNGYYLLDYWDKQKDTEGKSLYSSYRLLKLVNYMMKSIEARDFKTIKDYRKAIMTPNEIDEFLYKIERQDELESDNSKKKIHSDVITTTTVDEDNKKILTEVPQVEGNIPTQREQQERFRPNEIDMMDIFLSDAVGLLNRTPELQKVKLRDKNGNEISLQDKLNDMLKSSIGVIPFEVEVRNAILEKLEALGIQNNKYSVANDLLNNTEMLELAKEEREQVDVIVEHYFENQLSRIREAQILNEEQLKTVISNMPTILYNEKEMNKIKLWSTYRNGSFEELISRDYTATDTMVDALIVLKANGIDLSEIAQGGKTSTTIEDFIKGKHEAEQIKIIKELQEISEEITKDWPIGRRLSTQKTNNILELKKEIENAGIILTLEEHRKILEKIELMEGITTREFVQVLVVLKTNGIDLSKIMVDKSTIEDLLKEKDEEEQNKIIEELQEISKEITKDWPIGRRLSTQKTRNISKLKNEIEKAGIILTLEEHRKILEKIELMEGITTREFVKVLEVLKINGIDLSKIIYSSTIEDLIKEKDEEKQIQIIKVLQEILEEITKDWPIGIRLDTQKHNMAQLTNEIEKARIILTLEEQEKILEKEGNAERSERKTREFVQALVVLKTNGIDLSKIAQSDLIENLIKEKDEDNQNKIIKELQEISKEITKDWPIGVRLSHQKKSNMAQLTNEIEKAGIILTLEEQEKILEKEGNAERSERKTKEFVQILVVLKTNGIDLSKILQSNLIEDLIKEKDKEEQNRIISELQEISEEITKDWPIGVRLNTQKTTNMTKLEKQIKEAGLKEMLSDKERKKILEKEDKKDLSERKIKEFVQVLVVLKTNGIDLSKIMVDKSAIEDLIKEKDEEEQHKIIKELQEINTEITQKWKIGERLTNQKMRNIASLKKEIERAGIILTLQEQQKILEKEGNAERSKRKTREFVQVLEVLKTKGIDVSKIVYTGTIEDLIEEKGEEEQKRIINELQEISEEMTKDWPIGIRLTTQKKKIEQLKKEIKESGLEEMLTDKERKKILGKTAQKKVKETVVEQKNKGELGQNQQIEEVFEETIRQAEQTQENENSVR